jgi:energy-converting hydrogenase Eha subunit E
MTIIALLTTALLFGGMVLYSFGFAAFLFTALPAAVAGPTIRRAFPYFYLFVIASATIAAALVWPSDMVSAALLAFIAASTVPTRQVLMSAINAATDTGAKTRFKWLHGASVLITLLHIGLSGWVLIRFI